MLKDRENLTLHKNNVSALATVHALTHAVSDTNHSQIQTSTDRCLANSEDFNALVISCFCFLIYIAVVVQVWGQIFCLPQIC